MGSTVAAECPCGYQKPIIKIGGGLMSFTFLCCFPIHCSKCEDLVEGNVLEEPLTCPECESLDVKAYDHPELCKEEGNIRVATWLLSRSDEPRRDIFLTDGEYYCPHCKEYTLRFRPGGIMFD